MHTDPQESHWIEAPTLAQLLQRGQTVSRLGGRQIALFVHEGQVLACNNRCPHEGYPLCEGTLDTTGVLTCQWHNWKFDLRSGTNLYGGDALRVYPVRMDAGRVWVDVSEPPAAQRIATLLAQLDTAMDDNDPARITRELARLEQAVGESADAGALAISHAISRSHERLRYGMTHAYAGADAWLTLRDTLADPGQRLACVGEALAHIGFDTMRESPYPCPYPYTTARGIWNPTAMLQALEAQDEPGAIAQLNDALARGLAFGEMEPVFAQAALAHYNDFGHSLIYLTHVRSLIARLGPDAAPPLLRAWVRALVYATREDLLPDFKGYADALAQWPSAALPTGAHAALPGAVFEARTIRQTLAATVEAARQHDPLTLWQALMQAGAQHLLRFDERRAARTDNPVGDDVGWLDFSHALTFGHALRQVCTRHPELWPQGLLQMALFVGRNTPHLADDSDSAAAQAAWQVADPDAFDALAIDQIIDHGIGLPIFPVHRLKTWLAVCDTVALGTTPETAQALRAAVRRLLSAQFKQRHALRNARQAQRFVERE